METSPVTELEEAIQVGSLFFKVWKYTLLIDENWYSRVIILSQVINSHLKDKN